MTAHGGGTANPARPRLESHNLPGYWSPMVRSRLLTNDELDLAVEDLKKSKHLIDRLPVVRLIQKPVELRRGGAEAADDLPLGQSRTVDSFLRLERQPVQGQVAEIRGVLVVFEDVVAVHAGLFAGLEHVREPFGAEFGIHVHGLDRIGGRRRELEVGKGE